jgi:hypothetical protein
MVAAIAVTVAVTVAGLTASTLGLGSPAAHAAQHRGVQLLADTTGGSDTTGGTNPAGIFGDHPPNFHTLDNPNICLPEVHNIQVGPLGEAAGYVAAAVLNNQPRQICNVSQSQGGPGRTTY